MIKVLWLSPTPCGAIEIISPNIVTGGWMQSLEEELVKNSNIELHVAYYSGSKLESFKHKNTFYHPVHRKNSGTKFWRLFSRALPDSNKDKVEIANVLNLVQKLKPDLIHVHGTEDNWGLIQKYIDIPTVVSIQGLLSPYSEKFFSGISKFDAYRYEGIKTKLTFNSYLLTYRNMLKFAVREKEILKITKNIIGRTSWDYRITRLLSPNSNYYVGNEMLRPVFYSKRWKKTNNKKFTIISTGANRLYKGLESIYLTSKILTENGIEHDWLVVGQDSKDTMNKIILSKYKYIDKMHNVKLIGTKTSVELCDILLKSDLFCQVSHIENSPNSLCEAMIIGMPIIATMAGGTDTILENEKEGILLQDGDPYSIAGAIAHLKIDFDKTLVYSMNAYDKANERHNKSIITENLIKTYNQILGI